MSLCGTRRGYRQHLKAGETTCGDCRRATNEYNRRHREGIGVRPHSKSARNTVVDVLSTYTEWMTFSALVGRVQLHRPDLTELNIRRAVDRLRGEGRLDVRERGGLQEYFTDEWAASA